ncbi:hypothetical protein SAMN05428642_103346 [Flaviramulus basaltis]|uniref:Uncharacterized protein n=1 Tax=Flaviramulus basaltis TaxID=369401 RepID=A0A1K2IN53_9FLAO|nr:hypothetical protein [Flaviramulus basaltis]SFZ93807.1 hypothetical protein SAMN05428642_103346 [Flaviramulus basaltis]
MKNLIYITLIAFVFISCKQKAETKLVEPEIVKTEISTAQKIANAHGFENWKNVSEAAFTFNGSRSWIWKPKTNDVMLLGKTDTIQYNRSKVDSLLAKTDGGFINDKFWLLVPFQLVWDKGATISNPVIEESPINKSQLNKITLTYSNESGGYTPGDAYDIYYNDDFLIKEWIFRRSNQAEPSLATTFENYQDFNGIKIALEHKNAAGDWNLKFSDIKVTLE